MLRPALTAALMLSLKAFADDDEPQRTDPAAGFAAEGQVMRVSAQSGDDGVDWAEVTFKVTRCIAGPCIPHQSVKVTVAMSQWRSKHGETMGLVKYDWKDKKGGARNWAIALRLDDMDEKDRFERDSETAVANVGSPASDSAVATR